MIHAFGDYELDTARVVLRRGGDEVRIEPQVYDVLLFLVEHRNRVVTKEELLDEIWGDRFVSESALTTRIRSARRAVGDDGNRQSVIRTVHGRGYEFVAPVESRVADAPTPPPVPSASVAGSPVAGRLPVRIESLIGRDDVLAALELEMEGSRLLTLVGPGGVGKTSLAYELARRVEGRYPDGVVPCELVTVDDADECLGALATALDVQDRQGGDLEAAVRDFLRSRRLLVVLDNCEHVVERIGLLVDEILRSAPGVTVLATSREPLAVASEQVWRVEPLPVPGHSMADEVPASVALFVERARAADQRFELDAASAAAVAEICRRLDGMPLAIELAAARTGAIAVEDIAARLDQRFRLLRGVRRVSNPRHRALEDTVRWSYDLLDLDERMLFERLSVFAGPFDLAAAEAVCGGGDLDVLDVLGRLAERSMVARRVADGSNRYEQLETLRAWGRSRLPDENRIELSALHGGYHAALAAEVAAGLAGPQEPEAIRRGHASFADLRAAQRAAVVSGRLEQAFDLIASIREYATRTMHYEVFSWADAAVAAEGAQELERYPEVLGVCSYGAWIRGEFDRALALAAEVQRLEQAREGASGLAERTIGNVQYVLGRPALGDEAMLRQQALAEESGDLSRRVHANYMSSVAHSRGDRERALALAAEAEVLARRSGSPTDLASAAVAAAFSADDPKLAIETFHRAADLAEAAGNRWMRAFALTEANGLLLGEGRMDVACRGLAEMVDTWFRAGEWSQQWMTLSRCVVALAAIDQPEAAARITGAVAQHTAIDATPMIATLRDRTLEVEADLRTRLGDDRYGAYRSEGAALPDVEVVQLARAHLTAGRGTGAPTAAAADPAAPV